MTMDLANHNLELRFLCGFNNRTLWVMCVLSIDIFVPPLLINVCFSAISLVTVTFLCNIVYCKSKPRSAEVEMLHATFETRSSVMMRVFNRTEEFLHVFRTLSTPSRNSLTDLKNVLDFKISGTKMLSGLN